jgi:hypothetical protein
MTLDIDEELCACFIVWQKVFASLNVQINADPEGNLSAGDKED